MFKTRTPAGSSTPEAPHGQSDAPATPDFDRFITLAEVKWFCGIGKTTIYQLINSGRFPRPIKIGGTASRWSLRDVREWQAACRANSSSSGRRP